MTILARKVRRLYRRWRWRNYLAALDAASAEIRAREAAYAAAASDRSQAVAELINDAAAGLLPEGVRFVWDGDAAAPGRSAG